MARTELERTVQPSLLERLTDDDPRSPADPAITREESVRRYRASVIRDLEWLLNTRRTPDLVPPALTRVQASVFAYGLPDTTGVAVGTEAGRAQLVRWVEETIAAFEPRLSHVHVTLGDVDQMRAPQVHFAVTALLRMDPSPEQVVFDTVHDLATGGYVVRDAGTAPARAAA